MTLLTTAEIAEFLRITPQHVTRLCRRGEIPHLRIGPKGYRFVKDDVIQWLRQSAEPGALEKMHHGRKKKEW